MILATCIRNTEEQLGIPEYPPFWPRSLYDFNIGCQYIVYAMELSKDRDLPSSTLDILVVDDSGTPCFAPIGLFSFQPAFLPARWEFALNDGKAASGRHGPPEPDRVSHWIARWGYPEFVRNPEHAGLLEDMDAEARDIFFAEVESCRNQE